MLAKDVTTRSFACCILHVSLRDRYIICPSLRPMQIVVKYLMARIDTHEDESLPVAELSCRHRW